jgi:hypothetical protein
MTMTLRRLCDGVFFNDGAIGEQEISHCGTRLFRFMDRFYLRCPPDELEPDEVSALCRERAKSTGLITQTNQTVREIFKRLVYVLKPSRFLEIGAGSNPILSPADSLIRDTHYVRSDADAGQAKGLTEFSLDSGLNYHDDHLDLAAAVFVLHFRFYEGQIAELQRCLKTTGAFVANVYSRSNESRATLKRSFLAAGFQLAIIPDPHNLCRAHEYWIAAKREDSLVRHELVLRSILG